MVTNATDTTEVVETGEKRDRIGRRITPGPRREELVAAWRESGLTQAEFARREGIRAGAKLALAPEALALLINGVELRQGSLKAWYER